ncbi:MAG: O-antigen ligase family protein [Patescibacteria group bacterium]
MNLQKILRSLSVGLIFLIPIFPLIVADGFFFPFITGKAFYFRILVEVAFVAWILLAFLDAKYRPRFTALTISVTLFAVITLIADLLGVNPVRSMVSNFERMEGWLVIAHLWMFYMTATHLFGHDEEGKRMWRRWFNFSLGVAVVVVGYAFAQMFGWAEIHQGSVRLDASLGNAAYLAVYMLMHVGIAAYLSFVAYAGKIANASFLKWAYPLLALVFSFIIIQTQTRGTIIGLAGGALLALALYALFAKKESIRSRSIAAGAIGLILVLTGALFLSRDTAFVKNSPSLNRIASISLTDTKTQARAYVWPMALKGFTERPILGWGQENFNYVFNQHYNPKMWNQEQWFDRAHSVFLDWLVASGAVGVLSYLALYVFALMAVWKSRITIAEKSTLTGLIVGYAVHNIFVFDNLASYVFFFAILGFAGSLGSAERSSKSKVEKWLETKTFSRDAVEYIVAPIAIVALAAGIYFLNVRNIQANTSLIDALRACSTAGRADIALFEGLFKIDSAMAAQEAREQLISCATGVVSNPYPGPVKQAFYDLTVKQIQEQIADAPEDARMYILGGLFLSNLNQTAEAKKLLEKARELTPGKQAVAFQLATLYVAEGKKDEALALLKTAYDADPTYDDARSAYATSMIIAGKDAEARVQFDNDPTIFETQRAAQAYASLKQYDKAIAIYNRLIAADAKNVNLRTALAQTQYSAGMTWSATETLRAIAKDFPEYKEQIDAAIKEVQAGAK